MATRARELPAPSSILHLPAYRPPNPDRVRHDVIWARAMAAPTPWRVTFPK